MLVVVGLGNSLAGEFATSAAGGRQRHSVIFLTGADVSHAALETVERSAASGLIIFLSHRLTEHDRPRVEDLFRRAGAWNIEFVGIVTSFRVNFGDRVAAKVEEYVVRKARNLNARVAVFRPGHVLGVRTQTSAWLRRFSFCCPLLPRWLRGCFIDAGELFAAIVEEQRDGASRGPRVYSLLGPNRAWRDVLAEHLPTGIGWACLVAVAALLSFSLIDHLAGLMLALIARWRPAWRSWNVGTLRPRSMRELLTLCNKYNYRYVKIVGYNNGVVHFGHRYPGKTLVSTVHCNRVAMSGTRHGSPLLKADCGATVRKALDFLAGTNLDLPVVPNYSYVCLGTSMFVPIHGSASDFSTVADTIARVVLYDPKRDQLIVAARDRPKFREHVYDLKSEVLLLRLYLQLSPKSPFNVMKETWEDPTSDELLIALRDNKAANVEIRKSDASAKAVTVFRYTRKSGDQGCDGLELPRDGLGRLWDRLEENPVTSFLMHTLTRHLAWHVELFFDESEFAIFWARHRELPLKKLQLRYIRRDGLPHSPFRDHDCVSVDLFMFRRHRRRFETYLKATFITVRTNPGKHSR